MNLQRAIGIAIQTMAEQAGHSTNELAALIDSNRQNVYRVIQGRHSPTIWTLELFARALKTDVSAIIAAAEQIRRDAREEAAE